MAGKTPKKPIGPIGPTPTPHQVSIDGNQVVGALRKAGLDPAKLDLRQILGPASRQAGAPALDITELESLLRGTGTAAKAAAHWHVTATISVSRD